MQKKKIMFFIYGTILIIALALFLILHNKTEREKPIYAETITINGPREISMVVNSNLELLTGYSTITPKEATKDLTMSVKSKSVANTGGLTISNNVITATKQGSYSVTFSLPQSNSKILSETITISVLDQNDEISVKTTNLFLNEPTTIDDLITISTKAEISLQVDDKVELKNECLNPNELGETIMKVYLVKNYLKRVYSYSFFILPKDDFKIAVTKIIKDEFDYKIQLNITNRDKQHCTENITILSTENVKSITAECPIISLIPINDGYIKITVALTDYPEILSTIEFNTW